MTTYADLAARPRLEEAVARYEQMQQRIREALDTELGPLGAVKVLGTEAPAGSPVVLRRLPSSPRALRAPERSERCAPCGADQN